MKTQPSLKRSPVTAPAERVVKDIRRQTRRHFSAEDKIRIVLDGLRGEDSIAEIGPLEIGTSTASGPRLDRWMTPMTTLRARASPPRSNVSYSIETIMAYHFSRAAVRRSATCRQSTL